MHWFNLILFIALAALTYFSILWERPRWQIWMNGIIAALNLGVFILGCLQ